MSHDVESILTLAREQGIALGARDGGLVVDAPKGSLSEEFKAMLAAHKEPLLRRLSAARLPALQAQSERQRYPLSSAQLRMWAICQSESLSRSYNMAAVFEAKGPLDLDRLEKALQSVVERHESLRTRFAVVEGEPWQFVVSSCDFRLDQRSCKDARETEVEIQKFVEERFDLASAPLFRVLAVCVSRDHSLLAFAAHHIICDGWSVEVLVRDALLAYEALESGASVGGRALDLQYRDFVAWHKALQASDYMEEARAFWRAKLAGDLEPLALPTDRNRPARPSGRGDSHQLALGKALSGELREFARDRGATLFAVLAAVFKVLLHRYTHQEDVIVGIPASGRVAGLQDQIGLFVNSLPLRSSIRSDQRFSDVVAATQESLQECYEWQHCPFERILEAIEYRGNASRNPLFDVMLVMDEGWASPSLQGIAFRPIEREHVSARFDLAAIFRDGPDGIGVRIEYSSDIFDTDRIRRMLEHFKTLLESALANPEEKVGELNMLPAWERGKLLVEFNDTAADYPLDRCVHELFEDRACEHPDRVALSFGDAVMTYGEMDARSNALARRLKEEFEVPPGSLIALLAERSFDMVVGILAILKAGGAYVPIDPEYPAERIRFMLEDCGTSLVLCNMACEGQHFESYVMLDLRDPNSYASDSSRLCGISAPSDLAYCIYTSGSTGVPKGILVEHRSLANLSAVKSSAYSLDGGSRVLQFSSLSFDASIAEIFPVLLSGGRLVLLSKEARVDPGSLAEAIHRGGVNVATFPPSLLASLDPAQCEGLSLVISAGEVCLPETVRRWSAGRRFINAYGPSECAVCTTLGEVDASVGESVPIGRPVSNASVHVLSPAGSLCPIGVVGELCIGGVQVARGYLNRPELTSGKFVADPFNPGGRIYRTGDIGRWRTDGNLEFLGRMDDQVKIRGYRIELGEVEAAMLRVVGVRQVAMVAREVGGDRQLCGYYTGEAEESAVRAGLKEHLPDYMVPGFIMRLESLPLTTNGKVDRKALPKSEWSGREYEAPRTELEERLAVIWREVLGVDRVGINESFFDLGGHSLKAVQLVSQIQCKLGVTLSIRDVFGAPILRDLAKSIAEKSPTAGEVIPHIPNAEIYALSNAQRRLWVLSQFDGGNVAYNMPGAYVLEGDLNLDAFRRAFERLVQRHESLRTTFEVVEGKPWQRVHVRNGFKLEEADLRSEPDAEQKAREWAMAERVQAFDLERGPLVRAKLVRMGESRWVFLFTMHHIVSDGWSMGVLVREVLALYEAYRSGKPDALPELTIQYRDYAAWQNAQLAEGKLEKSKAYWHGKLGGELPILDLPTDRPRPATKSYRGAMHRFTLNKSELDGLKELGREEGATLFMVLTAAVRVLLYRYTGQEDIILGAPIAGRDHGQLRDQIGFYVGTLALRDQLKPQESFKSLVAQVKQTMLEAYEHQQYPFDKLVEELGVARDMSRHPVFDVMVVMNERWAEPTLKDVQIASLSLEQTISKFDLTLAFDDLGKKLEVGIEYDRDLFDADRIERMQGHFEILIRSVLKDRSEGVGATEILPDWEKHKLLVEFNDTAAEYPKDKTIHELFEQQVKKAPENIAVVFEEQKLTYAELNRKANQLARVLRKQGVKPDQLVAIMVERSLEMIVGILGILKSGGAYVPIDPNYPKERVKYMLEDSQAKLVLTQTRYLPDLAGDSVTAIDLESSANYSGTATNLTRVNKSTDLIYVIYTSGSTGKPKGVMIEHRSVVNYITWARMAYLKPGQYFALCTSLSFDLTVTSIFAPLSSGGTVKVFPEGPTEVTAILEDPAVDVVKLTPSHLRLLSFVDTRQSKVHVFIVGGEDLKTALAQDVYERYRGRVRIYNEYGPTEATVGCMLELFTPHIKTGSVSIGKAAPNVRLYITDKYGRLLPLGVAGELCIGGAQVARGYLNRMEFTAERFIHDPFNNDPASRLYRTGDLGRWLPDGNIEYLGRIDDQVKIRGFRIELGEVEAVLAGAPGVTQAAVALKPGVDGEKCLCGYYVGEVEEETMRSALREKLPEYMVPSFLVKVLAIPLNSNGKIERRLLPKPSLPKSKKRHAAPRDELGRKLAEIWQEVLGIDAINIRDDFFALGGHSLKAVQLAWAISTRLGLNVEASDIFKHTVFGEQVRFLKLGSYSRPPAHRKRSTYPVSYQQERILWKARPDDSTMNVTGACTVTGDDIVARATAALEALLQRHPILRARINKVSEGFEMTIKNTAAAFTEQVIVNDATASIDEIIPMLAEEGLRPFQLFGGELFRCRITRLAKHEIVFFYCVHHIIYDGWSASILRSDLATFFNSANRVDRKKISADYGFLDMVLHDRSYKIDHPHVQFWLPRIPHPYVNLRFRAQMSTDQYLNGARRVELDIATVAEMKREAASRGFGLLHVTMAALAIVVFNETGRDRFPIGMPFLRRPRGALSSVGYFADTHLVSIEIDLSRTPWELIADIKRCVTVAKENELAPFPMVLSEAQGKTIAEYQPPYDIRMAYNDFPRTQDILRDVKVKPVPIASGQGGSTRLITLYVHDETQLHSTFFFNEAAISSQYMNSIVNNYKAIAPALVSNAFADLRALVKATSAETPVNELADCQPQCMR